MDQAPSSPTTRIDARTPPSPVWLRSLDVLVVVAIALVAAAARGLADGSAVRLALTLPILFFVPGYLLIQALVRAASVRERVVHGVAAVGISPALVGLLALLTAITPGGFRPTAIVAVVTVTCMLLAGVALWRRMMVPAVAAAA